MNHLNPSIIVHRIAASVALCLALALGASAAQAQTSISAVYFGQTHVQKATDPYFGLVGNREVLIKAHVVNPNGTTPAPTVTATLVASGLPNLVLTLTGPATLPASIPDGLGVVQHSYANTFTNYIPASYVKTGLQVTVNAGAGVSTTITNMKVGAPTKMILTMTDVQYFSDTNSDYPAGTFSEAEAKWPVSSLEVRRLGHVVFPELVIPPRSDVGAKAARLKSKADYTIQTGLAFDGEQAAALAWNGALKRAAGRSGRWSYYYLNVYNAFAGGQAGGYAGVGSGTSLGILHHESGHAMSLPHWGDNKSYPYKGAMYGISAPAIYNATHAGPVWAFDLRTKPGTFIPPTTQPGNAGGKPVGTYKADPMQGGGFGWQEPAFLMNHFSDYSMNQMRNYLNGHVVVWNPALNGGSGSWAQWNSTTGGYTTAVSNNGVEYPVTRDAQVISIMASISGSKPDVTMVYPPIGPYTAGLIRLFDPTVAADRTAAQSIFSPANGSDLCVRVVQGGVTKTYMLAASWLTNQSLTSSSSLVTEAVNLPASGGTVTKIQLLLTPDVEDNGLPANPQVLSTWAPLLPDTAAFAVVPKAYSPSAITMKATTGEVAFGYTGTVEYLFTETTGNPGATSSGWQTSPSYTDTGLQAGTQYSYTVSMRAGSLTSTTSAAASATTLTASATNNVTVNSTQQFSLATTKGFQNVTGLGTFNAGGADKLVVVISTEDGSNRGTGYVYGVKYNGKTMIQAIQEHGGPANGSAAIFYLDNPGSIGTGTIQVSAESPNGGIGTAYALSNTMTGVGVTNSRFGSTANSVSLTTAGERSMVIAVLQNSGNPNNAGTPTANSPLTQTASGSWGTFWGSHASGYQLVATPTAITPTFTTLTGSGYNINIAAAEFPAKAGTVPVVLPNVWNQSDGGAQNWTTAANWSDSVVPNPTSTTTMDFSTVDILADTTLNLGANRTARIWKFGDTAGTENWIVSAGNTLTLAGTTPTIQVDNNTTQIDAVVAGTAGLTKTGAGTLNLTGNNTYTGNTTLTGGTLQFAKTAAMPATGTVAVGNEATLAVNLGGTGEWTTATSGNGSVGGLLAGVGGQGNPVTYTGNTTLGLDTTNASGNQTYASAITNVGTSLGFAKLGNGTLTLTAANTYSGPTTIGGGTLRFSGAGRLTSGNTTGTYASPVFIAGDAILEYSGSSGQTFSGAITGGGNLKSTTNVDFIMSNKANDFGSFSIGNGRVFINTNAGALPSAAAVDITGGLLVFGSATEVSDNPFTVASNGGIVTRRTSGGTILTNVKLPGTGTVIFNNDDVNTGTLNITNDLIVDEYDPVTGDLISTGAQILTGTLTIQVGGSRMSTTTGSLGGVIFGGKIIGNGSLNVTSGGNAGNTNGLYRSGVLTLTAPNDYAGGTTITTGTLALGDNNVLPATPLTIADGKLDAATFSDTLGTLAITGNATINLGAGAALSFANSSAVSWPGTLTLTGDFTSGSSIRFGNSGTALTSAQLSKISKSAPNALDRFSLNSAGYLVGATVGSPTYTITNTSPAGNGTCTPTGVTSVGSGGSQTYTLKPNAGYALGTLTVNGVSVPPVLSYAFDNVSANQTISATFVVQPTATLYWDSDGTTPGFGNTPGTWGSTSFWTTDSSGSSPLIAITTDTASLVNFGSATLNYDNPAVAIAQEGVEAREITFGAGQSTALTLSGGNITFFSTAVITVNNNSHTIEAALTGADTSLTKAGTGSLTLSGNNTYTGTTVIAAGTLRLGASDVIPDGPGNGNVTVTSTLDLQTFSETINGLDGNGTVDTAGGGSSTLTVGGANTTSTFNGTLTDTNGTLALAKIGSGNLTLTGNNTYTGQTTITAGNLIIGAGGTTGSIDSTTGINNAGALIYNRSNNATVAYSISGNGTLTKQGAGVLTLSGDNSYTGATTVSSGTLRLASSAALGNSTLVAIGGNRLEIVTDTALSASPALSSQVGTFVSDRATPGAGLTQVFGNASIGNGLTTFAAGGNVTSGAAVIQLGNVTNNNGSTATPGLNPTTANLVITGNVTLGASNAGTANLTLGGNSSENSIGGAIVNGTRVTGNVIKSNTSTWTLSGTNTYTGNTSVTGGLLITTKAAALPGFNTAAKVVFNGGTIGAQVGGSGWTEGEMLGLIGNATKTSGALGIDTTNGNLTQGATAYSLGNLGLTKLGANTLTLTQTNTYNGTTTISEGTLALGANNVLPATAVTVGNATLNAGTFTDTVGTLNVAGNATINLGSGAALAFADSSAMDWSNGTLTLTGNFTSGSSLRFGTSNSSLTSTQLGKISAPGGGAVALNPSGFLINALGGYAAWAATNASGTTPAQDQDNDGVSNAIEYVLGGTALTNDFAKLPLVSMSGGNILFTFLRDQASINASTSAAIQVSTTLLTWPTSFTVGADTATSSPGVTVIKGSPAGFDTVTLSVLQSAYPNFFGRLSVTITQ